MADLAEVVSRFAGRLRAEGLPVGLDRCHRFATAVELADPATTNELYWCARVTLVADASQLPAFDRVFAEVFAGATPEQVTPPPTPPRNPAPEASSPTGAAADQDPGAAPLRTLAVATERLAEKDFGQLSPDELALLAVLMRRLRLATPLRRSRRFTAASRGRRVDLRTTLRRAQRTGGFPIRLARHRQASRHRRLVVICDISGSMESYARAMLQLVYSASNAGQRTEVFTFATRLTRLTRVLARVQPDVALARAGTAAPDWSGGTRIGEALKVFLDRYGARGIARGAVVLIISDGWETGDAAVLGAQMARLSRLAHRIVWANPRTAAPGYQPLVAGMAAAWPFCDAVVSAHSLHALDELLAALSA